jgi:hypothetical protein
MIIISPRGMNAHERSLIGSGRSVEESIKNVTRNQRSDQWFGGVNALQGLIYRFSDEIVGLIDSNGLERQPLQCDLKEASGKTWVKFILSPKHRQLKASSVAGGHCPNLSDRQALPGLFVEQNLIIALATAVAKTGCEPGP